jgi:hypothetical protein
MVPVVLGLAAGCCFGWADFLGGLATRRIGARTVVLGGQAREPVTRSQGVGIGVALTGAALLTGAA